MRVDDAIFRMTRERVVCFLADADEARAREIMERLLIDFSERFTPSEEPRIALKYFEVTPEIRHLSVREVLPSIFSAKVFAS
jgi:GGDEF domain-containing protein